MFNGLYLVFIAPLEFLMRLVLEWGFSLTHSWGWSLVLLSLVVNTALLPLQNWAERGQEAERALRRRMARHEGMLRECFQGQERFALLSALRRLNGWTWRLTLRASMGLLVQIPFFIAAFHLLADFGPLKGRTFGPLSDLAAPDALLALGGVGVNLLPFVMTAANLLAAFVYARDLARRDKVQVYGIALLFLVLLYTAPSALVLYWTLNNVYSLGKNFVGKKLMRHPPRQMLGKCWRSVRPYDGVGERGCVLRRFTVAARCSFAVASIFWLYACTAAFIRHGSRLDGDLTSATLSFAGQCVLTALLGGIVLAALFPPPIAGRKRARYTVFMCACAAALFAFQFKLFSPDFAVGRGRSLLGGWDGARCLYFAVWALGLCVVAKFLDTLSAASGATRRHLLKCVNPRSNVAGPDIPPPRPTLRDTFMLACLMGAVCGFFLWYFMPFSTYLLNTNEFEFNGWELFCEVTPWCLLTSIVCALFFCAMNRLLPGDFVKWPWKCGTGTCGRTNILSSIVLVTFFALWLEGAFLSYGLPQLDGETNLFNSAPRLIVDSIIVIELLIVGIRYWRYIIKRFALFISLLITFSFASLTDIYREAEKKVDPRSFDSIKEIHFVSKNTLYSQLRFSDNHNIIILLVDTFDTPTFEKTIEKYPELKEIFGGFLMFRDNLGPGGLTNFAIPQILSGKTYEEKQYFEFVQEALVGRTSIAANAVKNNYAVFIDAAFWFAKSDTGDRVETLANRQEVNLKEVIPLFVFRFLPYYGKSLFEDMVNIKNREVDIIHGDDNNKITFNRVLSRVNARIDRNVLQFLYFFGIHEPLLVKNNVIETARIFINDFKKFADILQENNLYDKSTVIIIGDHGRDTDRNFMNPVFMIKNPYSKGNIRINDDMMSSNYINSLLNWLYKYRFEDDAVFDFLKTLPEVRTVYKPGFGKMEARGTLDTLSLTIADRKSLRDNVIYTLSPGDFIFPYANYCAMKEEDTHKLLEHPESVNISSSKINMSFLHDDPPGTRKVLTFMIDSWNNNGSLEIYDKISGNKTQWVGYGPVSLTCTIDHKGYTNVQFVPLSKSVSTLRYLAVSDVSSPVPKLPHDPRRLATGAEYRNFRQ